MMIPITFMASKIYWISSALRGHKGGERSFIKIPIGLKLGQRSSGNV